MSRLPIALALALLLVLPGCDREPAGPETIELWVGDNSRPYLPRPAEVAQLLKADLEAAGFRVEIVTKEWGTYLEDTKSGKHQLCILGWTTDNGDPDNFLYALLDQDNAKPGSALNVSFYRNPELHDVLIDAQNEADAARRVALYHRAQEMIHRDVPMVPLVYAKVAHAMRSNVIGFHQNPIGKVRLHTVRFEGESGGTLVFARGSESVTLDPVHAEDGESIKVIDNVYETLVDFELDGPALRPGLARTWSASEDRLTWTFELFQGVRFHDGTPCDAKAVVASFERLLAQRETSPYGSNYRPIRAVRAEGEHRVVFELERTSGVFLANLAMHPASVVSPKAMADEASLARNPVGTGAFRLEEWVRDTKLSIVRNETYWDAEGEAKLERVVFTVEKEPTTRVARLRDGRVHFVDNPHPNDFEALAKDANVKLLVRDGMNFCYLAMNNDRAPFKDNPALRRAVAHAIHKERIVSRAYAGYGQVAVHPMPPTLAILDADGNALDPWAHDIEDHGYDPAKARRILEEAGYLSPGSE